LIFWSPPWELEFNSGAEPEDITLEDSNVSALTYSQQWGMDFLEI
jgi:hypothetical protein